MDEVIDPAMTVKVTGLFGFLNIYINNNKHKWAYSGIK